MSFPSLLLHRLHRPFIMCRPFLSTTISTTTTTTTFHLRQRHVFTANDFATYHGASRRPLCSPTPLYTVGGGCGCRQLPRFNGLPIKRHLSKAPKNENNGKATTTTTEITQRSRYLGPLFGALAVYYCIGVGVILFLFQTSDVDVEVPITYSQFLSEVLPVEDIERLVVVQHRATDAYFLPIVVNVVLRSGVKDDRFTFSLDKRDLRTFEKKLREAEDEVGVEPSGYIPVQYKDMHTNFLLTSWSFVISSVVLGFFIFKRFGAKKISAPKKSGPKKMRGRRK